MKIAVGSKNPVKIEAVHLAFQSLWPDQEFIVEGVSVPSGVSDQPMSDEESIKGARNRARQALEITNFDYGVGLEGGLHQIGEHYFNCGWIVVIDKNGNEGIGSTVKILTPPRILKFVKEGLELGDANDVVFGKTNSKQGEGHVGLMTKNIITRSDGYKHGVIVALSRFIHPDLF